MSNTNQSKACPADPCMMVIFGAVGDLAKRKLITALYNLAKDQLLAPKFAIIGLSYHDLDTKSFRQHMTDGLKEFSETPVDPAIWDWFLERIYYVKGDFKDPTA